MRKIINIAIELESIIADKLQTNKNCYSEDCFCWSMALSSQKSLIEILNQASLQPDSFPEYPDFIEDDIVGVATIWKEFGKNITSYDRTQMVELMIFLNLHTQMSDFYIQSAANIPHPLSKFFLQSLSEIKKLQALRMEMLKSTIQNYLWSHLGYSPFHKN